MDRSLFPFTRAFLGSLVLTCTAAHAQNIGINVNGATPHASALLDIDVSALLGTKRGLLIPRMSSAERAAIPAPATGLLVFDTTTNGFWYFNGTIWVQLLSGSGAGWSLAGNAGTVTGTNFLGTTDAVPFEVRVAGARSGYASPSITANTSWGYQALASTVGNFNTATGYQALQSTTSDGDYNSAFGHQALAANTSGYGNTAVGHRSLYNQTTGSLNTATGHNALWANTTGNNNTATGAWALGGNTTGVNNTASGLFSLQNNTTGSENTATGGSSLQFNTTGNYNTASGSAALWSNTTGIANSATGYQTLYSNTTGAANTATGYQSLLNNTTGYANAAAGSEALRSNTTGAYNTATGSQALFANTTGQQNAVTGASAMHSNTTGSYNVANGTFALYANTTGIYNVANGNSALYSNITGNGNTANGHYALFANTTGLGNTSNGYLALSTNTTAGYNTANGLESLRYNTTGPQNTATGAYALTVNTIGTQNVANGYGALFSNSSGGYNTGVGANSLLVNSTGSGNTALGYAAGVLSGNLTNATALGYNAKVATSNSLVLGGTILDAVNVGIGTTSPTLGKLHVEGMAGNTVGYFKGGAASQGLALVADWPGLYFNCYFNGTINAMAATGYPSVINSFQNGGGLTFSTTSVVNTIAGATVAVPERMRISGTGNVGIGTIAPAYLLEVNGSAARPGGGSWIASSDARLKKDVVDYRDGLSQLMRIRPVRFHYNALSGQDPGPEYVGVIAQELEKVAPYMVGRFERDGAEYLNVDNSSLIYMLVNGMQEQQVQLEELRKVNAVLLERQGILVPETPGKAETTTGTREVIDSPVHRVPVTPEKAAAPARIRKLISDPVHPSVGPAPRPSAPVVDPWRTKKPGSLRGCIVN